MDLNTALAHINSYVNKTPYIASFCCLASMVLVFNSVFIYTVVSSKRLHTITNKIVLSLAVSDLFQGAIVVPLFIMNVVPIIYLHSLLCVAIYSIQITGNLVAAMHLLVVTIERYVAIMFPLRHRLMLVSRKLPLMIALCWIPPIVLGSSPLMGWSYYNMTVTSNVTRVPCHYLAAVSCSLIRFYLGVIATVLGVTWWCYVHMFLIATRQTKRSSHLGKATQTTNRSQGAALKPVMVLMSTVGYNTVTTLPVIILLVLHCHGYDFEIYAWTVCMVLFFSNSVMDPLIYGLGNQSIRAAFLKNVLKRSGVAHCGSRSNAKPTGKVLSTSQTLQDLSLSPR